MISLVNLIFKRFEMKQGDIAYEKMQKIPPHNTLYWLKDEI